MTEHGKLDVMKIALTAMVSVVLTGLTAYIALGRNLITRADLKEYVQESTISRQEMETYVDRHSPYANDKSRLESVLATLASTVAKQQGTIETVQRDVDASKTNQTRIETKLDILLSEARNRSGNGNGNGNGAMKQ
ncbi:MAG TPA: hypothetical protein VGN72_06520 [Tepidisphaeraceae bacterium]|jgi:uncharacterized coiled-coil protein SlyX|nr:hypothetical protein [Tepidisphaeraceae bacterium]